MKLIVLIDDDSIDDRLDDEDVKLLVQKLLAGANFTAIVCREADES